MISDPQSPIQLTVVCCVLSLVVSLSNSRVQSWYNSVAAQKLTAEANFLANTFIVKKCSI